MEEINLKELFNYFKSNLLIIFGITISVLTLGFIYFRCIQKPMYNSYTTMVLASDTSNTGTITSQEITLNRNLVSTYRSIIKSSRVLSQVISNLNLNITQSELAGKIQVSSESDTEIIKVSVNTLNPNDSKIIANEIARVFSNEIVKIYNIRNVSIIDKAEAANSPYNVNIVKQTFLSFLVGLVLAFAVVFIMFYFDDTISSTSIIETKIGLPVLGVVPFKEEIAKKGRKNNE